MSSSSQQNTWHGSRLVAVVLISHSSKVANGGLIGLQNCCDDETFLASDCGERLKAAVAAAAAEITSIGGRQRRRSSKQRRPRVQQPQGERARSADASKTSSSVFQRVQMLLQQQLLLIGNGVVFCLSLFTLVPVCKTPPKLMLAQISQ